MASHLAIARPLDRAAEGLILAVVVLAPWAFGAVEAWAGFLIAGAVAALATLGALSGVLSGRGRVAAGGPGLAIAALALLAIAQSIPLPGGSGRSVRVVRDPGPPVASSIGAIAPDRDAAVGSACSLAVAWVFFREVARLEAGRRVAAAVAINAAGLALFAMLQALSWNGKIYWVRETPQDHAWFAGGPFVSHGHLAAYLNLGLGFAIGFLAEPTTPGTTGRGLRLGWLYVAAIVAAGVIGSQSRGGAVAMLVAAGAAFAMVGRRPGRRGLAAIGLAAIFLGTVGGEAALRRLSTVFDPSARGYAVRFEVWRAGLLAWLDRPALGAGLGGFATAASPFFRRDRGVVFTHAENEPVQLVAEGGLAALAIAGAGVVALVIVARRAWRSNTDRSLAIGATSGLLAVAIQSLCDFPLHIPAVAMACAASAGLLAKLAGRIEPRRSSRPRDRLVACVAIGSALFAASHSWSLARSEAALAGSGVPLAGPAIFEGDEPTKGELLRMEAALEDALIHRPDWSQGHLRLGATRMALYQAEVSGWLDPGADPDLADPLRLLQIVHEGGADGADLAKREPVSHFLIPAARSFLEARRANPESAPPHAWLASLHYLLEGDEPTPTLLDRTVLLAGADATTLEQVADVAVRLGDLDRAAACWRKCLDVRPEGWEQVADAAGAVLSPGSIRDSVAIGATHAIRFADRLYADDAEARDLLMNAAIDRLPAESGLSAPERLALEAHARAAIGQADAARRAMGRALALEPSRGEWREELVGWLLDAGEVREADRQARIGAGLGPDRPGFRRALDRTAESLARGNP